jgi:hypothetical protein
LPGRCHIRHRLFELRPQRRVNHFELLNREYVRTERPRSLIELLLQLFHSPRRDRCLIIFFALSDE